MAGFLLDTHVWLWLQSGNRHYISREFVEETTEWQRQGRLFVSAVSVWEIALLVSKGRLNLFCSVEHWLQRATEGHGMRLLPLSTEVLIESTRIPDLPHRDPADRMLIATARMADMTFVTRDGTLLEWSQRTHHARLRSDNSEDPLGEFAL